MKCKKCGTRFDGNFCPKCGTPAETQSESGSKKKRGKGCLITILVAVVFVVAVSALAGSPDEESDSASESTASAPASESVASAEPIDWEGFDNKSWADFKSVYETHKKVLEIVESMSNGELSAADAYTQIETRKEWFDQKSLSLDYYENQEQQDYLNIIGAMAIYDSDMAESVLAYLDSGKTSDLAKVQEASENVSMEIALISSQRPKILQNAGVPEEEALAQVQQELEELDQ